MNHSQPTSDKPSTHGGVQAQGVRLVVFSDDWGRHPSSCQHLVGKLLDRYPTLWVNTVGMRAPRLSLEDVGKTLTKIKQWLVPANQPATPLPANLTVINPRMYPGFRKRWQRRLNGRWLTRAVNGAMGQRQPGIKRIAITTIPVTADLVGRLDVDRWVYYCVDDFSVWPGLDGSVMDRMEADLVRAADRVVAVSQTLQDRVAKLGQRSDLLTHGIDLSHWGFAPEAPHNEQASRGEAPLPAWWAGLERPIALFWGVVDRRLDTGWCLALAQRCGSLVLAGPQQSPDPKLRTASGIHMPGPVAYQDLPGLAAAADVLVMPYADLPVTRAIQPLKLKEYLATGKPAIVRSLPATVAWSDAADVVETIDQLLEVTADRAEHGTPASQQNARQRLAQESWDAKARQFEQYLLA